VFLVSDKPEGMRKRKLFGGEQMVEIDFEKMDGLSPVVVQDNRNGDLLMVGFANREAYRRTLKSGYVTFYSRTRQKLWMKGETSGNRLRVISAATDCDNDCLLFRVEVEGDGLVCHEGTRSCFTKDIQVGPGCLEVER
jgi:phosphoribosyl-AMP cyclohydrolase